MRGWFLALALLIALPAAAQPRPTGRAAEIEAMVTALKAAPSEELAGKIEGRLRELWVQSASPSAQLLMGRGMRDLGNHAADDAVDDFDAALTLDPEVPEIFHRRALARAAAGDYVGALADIQETLKREPRHFSAFKSLSRIAEEREDWKGALAAWEKVMELSPRTPDGEERLKSLRRKAFGEGT